MIDLLLKVAINFICGAIVMVLHEFPKTLAAHYLTHSVFRKTKISLPHPKKYIDPIGLIMFTFSPFGVGWQKPYEHKPNRLKDKEKSLMPIALAGQLSSLVMVIFLLPFFRFLSALDLNFYVLYFIYQLIKFSMVLFIVNLMPVPPLDMAKMIHALSPDTYFKLMQNQRYIQSAFILLVALGIIEEITRQLVMPFINMFL